MLIVFPKLCSEVYKVNHYTISSLSLSACHFKIFQQRALYKLKSISVLYYLNVQESVTFLVDLVNFKPSARWPASFKPPGKSFIYVTTVFTYTIRSPQAPLILYTTSVAKSYSVSILYRFFLQGSSYSLCHLLNKKIQYYESLNFGLQVYTVPTSLLYAYISLRYMVRAFS